MFSAFSAAFLCVLNRLNASKDLNREEPAENERRTVRDGSNLPERTVSAAVRPA